MNGDFMEDSPDSLWHNFSLPGAGNIATDRGEGGFLVWHGAQALHSA